MAGMHVTVLESSMQRTRRWLKELEAELHGASAPQAYAAFRAVLHALRDCLPATEAVKFAAQMPLVARGIYYDGWKLRAKPARLSRHGFYERIRQGLRGAPDIDPALAAQAVVLSLHQRMSPGELRHVAGVLPTEVRALWAEIESLPAAAPPLQKRMERAARRAGGPGSRARRPSPAAQPASGAEAPAEGTPL